MTRGIHAAVLGALGLCACASPRAAPADASGDSQAWDGQAPDGQAVDTAVDGGFAADGSPTDGAGAARPVYLFYAVHTHTSEHDYQPYNTLGMRDGDINAEHAEAMLALIERIAATVERHGARATWEVVYGAAKGLCEHERGLGREDNVFGRLLARGHELGLHAHRTDDIEMAYDMLVDHCGITPTVTSGFALALRGPDAGDAQAIVAEAVARNQGLGVLVATENLGEPSNGLNRACGGVFGIGNDTVPITGNLMFPWRPDYETPDLCIDSPASDFVLVDHVPPGWIQTEAGESRIVGADDAARLSAWLDAAVSYMQDRRPDRVAAWGYITHLSELSEDGTGLAPPDEGAMAALDSFFALADVYATSGRVIYATASDAARAAFPSR